MQNANYIGFVNNEGIHQNLQLPYYPKVISMLDQEIRKDADIRTISALINKDPAMSQMVLKIINSPLFGMPNKISSITHAISLLGAEKIKLLILTPNLKEALIMQTDVSEFLWQRSIMNALCASKLTSIVDGVFKDDAYIAGMFQNSGSMILHKNYDDYEDVFIHACENSTPVYVEEFEHYGTSNIVIANSFAKKWTLPDVVSSTLLKQNEIDYASIENRSVRGLTAVLTLSNYLVNEVMDDNDSENKFTWHYSGNCALALDELVVNEALFVELGEEIKADLTDELDELKIM